MQRPDWAQMLNVIYENGGSATYHEPRDGGLSPENPFIEETRLTEEEVHEAVDLLRNASLVRNVRTGGGSGEIVSLGLTEKGFDVAHERMIQERQERHDRVIAGFTVVLGVAALIQALKAIYEMQYLTAQLSNTAVLILGLVILHRVAGDELGDLLSP